MIPLENLLCNTFAKSGGYEKRFLFCTLDGVFWLFWGILSYLRFEG